MRKFTLYNRNRTESIDLNGNGILSYDQSTGLGNKRANTIIKDSRVRSYVSSSKNNFADIVLKIMFGVGGTNAYAKYHELMMFIQKNGLNDLVLGYKPQDEELYVDVAISESTKTNKTQYGVLEEVFTFERLTPYYKYHHDEGTTIFIENKYYANILPKISIRDYERYQPSIEISNVNIINFEAQMPWFGRGLTITYEPNTKEFWVRGTITEGPSYVDLTFIDPILNDELLIIKTWTSGYTVFANNYSYVSSTLDGAWIKGFRFLRAWWALGDVVNEKFKIIIHKAIVKKNLATPILSESLNENVYKINEKAGINATVNLQDGAVTINGMSNASNPVELDLFRVLSDSNDYYITKIYESGTTENNPSIVSSPYNEPRLHLSLNTSNDKQNLKNIIDRVFIGLQFSNNPFMFTEYKFKLYIGTESAEYEPPYPILNFYPPGGETINITINQLLQSFDELIIDAEFKKITKNGIPAYDLVSKNKNTFPVIPPGGYVISSQQPIQVEWKEWVMD